MNRARVVKIKFPTEVNTPNGVEIHGLEISLIGFPTDLVSRAHEIAGCVLDHAPWHFVVLEMTSPMERGLGNNHDDCWGLDARAVNKPE